MPGLDRLGPQGQGSRTGRGMGKCNSPKTDDKTTDNPVEENTDFPDGAGNGWRFRARNQGGQGFGKGPGGRGRFRGGRGVGRGMGRQG